MDKKQNQPSRARVLYYGLASPQQEFKLRQLLTGLGIRWKRVDARDLNQTVGSLAELDAPVAGTVPDPATPPAESMIVMHQLSDAQINALLGQIRQSGLNIGLKAVVTEHNRAWTFLDLAAELRRENTFMQRFMALRSLVKKGDTLLTQNPDNPELAQTMAEARQLLAAAQEPDEIAMRPFVAAGQKLAALLQQLEPADPGL